MATARKTSHKPAASAASSPEAEAKPALPAVAPAPDESQFRPDLKDTFQTSLRVASQGVTAFQVKTLEALQTSADAQFAFVKALFATKSMSDLIDLQGVHAKQQFETLNAATKDISELIKKVSVETVEPIKSAISKSLKLAA